MPISEGQMIKKSYNGWNADVRTYRGQLFYSLVRKGVIPRPMKCELCGSVQGLTYHAEDYGSTWEEYLSCCHPLCCYCHATIHVRWRYPNRWSRFVARAIDCALPEFPYKTMTEVYGAYRTVPDLEEPVPLPESSHWLVALPVMGYEGTEKIALESVNGTLVPDFRIYPADMQEITGVRFHADTGTTSPYHWSKQ